MHIARPRIRRLLLAAGLLALFLASATLPFLSTLAQVAPQVKPSANNATATDGQPGHSQGRHPLDPLEPDEIRLAVDIVRKEKKLADSVRFVTVTLNEPVKAAILHPQAGTAIPREVFMVLLDKATGTGYEAVVNLASAVGRAVRGAPAGRPAVDHARRVRRMRGGGPEIARVPGGAEEARDRGHEPRHGRRLVGGSLRQRARRKTEASGSSARCAGSGPTPMDNGYAHPIEGLVTVIDLNRKEVVRVEDFGVVPVPPKAGELGPRRTIAQPAGRPQAARRLAGRRAELHGERPRSALAEVGVSRRVQPPRGPGAQHGRATTAARSCTAARSPR